MVSSHLALAGILLTLITQGPPLLNIAVHVAGSPMDVSGGGWWFSYNSLVESRKVQGRRQFQRGG